VPYYAARSSALLSVFSLGQIFLVSNQAIISLLCSRCSFRLQLFLRGKPHLQKYMRRLPKTHKKLPMKKGEEPDFYKMDKEKPLPNIEDAPVPMITGGSASAAGDSSHPGMADPRVVTPPRGHLGMPPGSGMRPPVPPPHRGQLAAAGRGGLPPHHPHHAAGGPPGARLGGLYGAGAAGAGYPDIGGYDEYDMQHPPRPMGHPGAAAAFVRAPGSMPPPHARGLPPSHMQDFVGGPVPSPHHLQDLPPSSAALGARSRAAAAAAADPYYRFQQQQHMSEMQRFQQMRMFEQQQAQFAAQDEYAMRNAMGNPRY